MPKETDKESQKEWIIQPLFHKNEHVSAAGQNPYIIIHNNIKLKMYVIFINNYLKRSKHMNLAHYLSAFTWVAQSASKFNKKPEEMSC